MRNTLPNLLRLPALLAGLLLLTACGNDDPPAPPPAIYGIGGSLSGLTGSAVTLENSFTGERLVLDANTTFGFSRALTDGEAYQVVVVAQPVNQTCTVSGGTGTIDEANIDNIQVRCGIAQYSVGGTVSGLSGNLLLQNNNGDDLALDANGAFTFATRIQALTTYKVAVQQQPAGQTCTVGGGSGTASGGNVTGITVQCVDNTNPFTIGGNVSGLGGTLVLQNNGGNNLTVTANGAFQFSSPLNTGTAYAVSVLTQPFGQICNVNNAGGTALGNVTGIDIQCVAGRYTVGGTVTGANGIYTLGNRGEIMHRSIPGPFTFPTTVAHGDPYDVTVVTPPFGQVCTVNNGSGDVSGAAVTDVAINCEFRQYSLGFSVSGLAGTLVLSNNGTANSVGADGNYTFSTPVIHGGSYNVRIATQPGGQTCAVSNAQGTALGDVTNIAVQCSFAFEVRASAPKTLIFDWAARPGATHYRLLKDDNGDGVYTQVGSDMNALSAREEIPVHGHDWPNARYRVEACIGSDCIGSVAIDTTALMLASIGYFKATQPDASDAFGQAVALSADGNTLAVGVPGEDSNATGVGGDAANNELISAGAVYVFRRSPAGWLHHAYIKASNTNSSDNFGQAVALSANGDVLVVGARNESSNATGVDGDEANNSTPNAGAAYVFAYDGSHWSQQAYLKASDTGRADFFGWSVAVSGDGNTVAVGAPGQSDETPSTEDLDPVSEGALYLFARSGSTWSPQAKLKPFNPDSFDTFGSSVSLSHDGNTLAAGAPGESSATRTVNGDPNNNLAESSGAAYVFTRTGALWTQQAYLKAANAGSLDLFGFQVVLSADSNTLAISAPYEDSVPASPDDDSLPDSGAIYVFARSGALWSQAAVFKGDDAQSAERLGIALSLSADGNTIAAATPGDDSKALGVNGNALDDTADAAGATIVFRRDGALWRQQAYVKASNTDSQDNFGNGVALAGDGNTLAVGAPRESSAASGLAGSGSLDSAQANNDLPGTGAVYLY